MLPHWEKMYAPFFEWILQQNFQAPQTRMSLSEAYMDGRWKYRPRNYYAKPSDFLTARIMHTNYPVSTKAQLMFIMSIPMTDRNFYKELNKVGKFKMDRKGRLTEFKFRDGNVVFEGEHDQHQYWSQDQYMTREEEEKEEEEQEGEKEALPIKKKRGAPNRRGRDSEPWNSGAPNQGPENVPVQANEVPVGGPDPKADDVGNDGEDDTDNLLEQDPDDVMMNEALTLGDDGLQNPGLDHGNEDVIGEEDPEDVEIDETGNSESGDVDHQNQVLAEEDENALEQELMKTGNNQNQITHLQDVPDYDYDPIPIATRPPGVSKVSKLDEIRLRNLRDSEDDENRPQVCTPRPSTRLLRHSRTPIRLAGVSLRTGLLDIIEEAEEKFEDQRNESEVAPDAYDLGKSSDDVGDSEDLAESPKASNSDQSPDESSDTVNTIAPLDQCHKGHSYCNGQDYQCYVKEQARRGKIQYAKNTTYYENLMRSIDEEEAKEKEAEEKQRFRVEQTKAREVQKRKERDARLARRSGIAEKASAFDVASSEPSTSESSTSRSTTSRTPTSAPSPKKL